MSVSTQLDEIVWPLPINSVLRLYLPNIYPNLYGTLFRDCDNIFSSHLLPLGFITKMISNIENDRLDLGSDTVLLLKITEHQPSYLWQKNWTRFGSSDSHDQQIADSIGCFPVCVELYSFSD